MSFEVFNFSANEAPVSSWIGGSILASISSFYSFYIPREEIEECGDSVFERKCQ